QKQKSCARKSVQQSRAGIITGQRRVLRPKNVPTDECEQDSAEWQGAFADRFKVCQRQRGEQRRSEDGDHDEFHRICYEAKLRDDFSKQWIKRSVFAECAE